MVSINLLNKGDNVLFINDQFLAIKRKNGTVDIYDVVFGEQGIIVDPVRKTCIGFGNGTVEIQTEENQGKVIMF